MTLVRYVKLKQLGVDINKYLDGTLVQKIQKHHFFKDIETFFHKAIRVLLHVQNLTICQQGVLNRLFVAIEYTLIKFQG